MSVPLMPKATAVWLIENTTLTFDQIADFCHLHALEVQAIADGDIASGMAGRDPVAAGELDMDEIVRCQDAPDQSLRLKESAKAHQVKKKGARYTPISKRQDKPSAILWLVKYYPKMEDKVIIKLIGSTKNTVQNIRAGTHAHIKDIEPKDPVMLGLCKQTELDEALEKLSAVEA